MKTSLLAMLKEGSLDVGKIRPKEHLVVGDVEVKWLGRDFQENT